MNLHLAQKLAQQKHQLLLKEAELQRLLKQALPPKPSLRHQAAHQLGALLVRLGARLQEKPIL